jgi:hypothetical protein
MFKMIRHMKKFSGSLLFLLLTITVVYSQDKSANQFWQEAFEGVPEPYQKWDFPDFNFRRT